MVVVKKKSINHRNISLCVKKKKKKKTPKTPPFCQRKTSNLLPSKPVESTGMQKESEVSSSIVLHARASKKFR
jgi:hypothetical protein